LDQSEDVEGSLQVESAAATEAMDALDEVLRAVPDTVFAAKPAGPVFPVPEGGEARPLSEVADPVPESNRVVAFDGLQPESRGDHNTVGGLYVS
jgi:hypothetical protein